jgi:hypothetical protein
MYLSRTPKYDESGRIIEEVINVVKLGKGKSTQKNLYTFDTSGNLIDFTEQDASGKQITRKEYIYRKDNRLQQMKVFDAENNLVDWQAWRYEIYKTNDRRQRVLE